MTLLSGLFGQGFNFDPRTLPEIHTDLIFAYIIYTFGWIAGIVLMILVATFLLRLIFIVPIIKNSYGKLIMSGFIAIFTVQFGWNILMNVGLLPLAGVSLPFISFGGSQSVMSMAAIGLILNIYKWRNISASVSM